MLSFVGSSSLEAVVKYISVFALSFVVTYLFTPIVMRFAKKWGVVDKPGVARINKRVVPRAGGLAVFLGFQISFLYLQFAPWASNKGRLDNIEWALSFGIGSCIILLVGLIDDIWDLKPVLKLLGQILAALVMFYFDVRVGKVLGINLSFGLDLCFTVLWFVAIINAFNLIDGLDGLATGLAIIGATGIAGALIFLRRPADALLLIGFIGACSAFLKYNFHPARIFLGDCGSMFLGFTLAAVGLTVGTKGATVASIGVPLLAVGVPIFDTMLAVWRRTMRRILSRVSVEGNTKQGGVMNRDLEHLHHRLLKIGFNQRMVALSLYGASGSLVLVGLLSMIFSSHSAGIFLIAFVIGAYVVVKHVANIELWDSGNLILEGLRKPDSRVMSAVLYPVLDCALLVFSLWVSLYFSAISTETGQQLLPLELKKLLRNSIPVWCGLPFIVLVASGTYSRVWSKARVSDFFLITCAVVSGILISWGTTMLLFAEPSRELTLQVLLFVLLSSALIVAVRAIPSTVLDLMSLSKNSISNVKTEVVQNTLLYGVGFDSVQCLRQLSCALDVEHKFKIVGLLDNNKNLKNKFIHGYKVLGGIRELPEILKQIQVSQVIVATDITTFEKSALLEMAKRHQINVSKWDTQVHTVLGGGALSSPIAAAVSSHNVDATPQHANVN